MSKRVKNSSGVLMRNVSIIGIGQTQVGELWDKGVRDLAAGAVRAAMRDAGIETADALYLGNMLSGEVSGQAHLVVVDEVLVPPALAALTGGMGTALPVLTHGKRRHEVPANHTHRPRLRVDPFAAGRGNHLIHPAGRARQHHA